MPRFPRNITKKAGLPAGSLVHIGDIIADKVEINAIVYDDKNMDEFEVKDIKECVKLKNGGQKVWIDIEGLTNIEVIRDIGDIFKLHPLTLEDILHTDQRPKMEDFGDYIYIVLRMLYYNERVSEIIEEQVSLVVGDNYVISFQEKEGDVFDPIRKRLREGIGRVRKEGPDFLTYSLLDSIVDNYFFILEKVGDKLEDFEDELLTNASSKALPQILSFKSEMIYLRKAVWPLREVISGLERLYSPLFKDTTKIYLKDVYDHIIQVIETVEIFRDTTSGLIDIHLSSVSNKMNEVMKVLTIISTIFIPLTFIAGIYGMNFKHMPELNWLGGYPLILGIMAAIAITMIIYFRRKKWL